MTVTPYSRPRLNTEQELYQFLAACQRQSSEERPAIASVSWEVAPTDPLIALQALATEHHPHFYFENRRHQVAIAAVGAVARQAFSGAQRFQHTQQFIETCLQHSQHLNLSTLEGGLSFFCSFTFFDQTPTPIFPPATVFVPQWQVTRREEQSNVTANVLVSPQANVAHLTATTWATLQTVRSLSSRVVALCHRYDTLPTGDRFSRPQRSHLHPFKASVESALQAITAGHLQKVVLAQALDVQAPQPFSVVRSLDNLRRRHPDCYVFSTGNGQQSFIGASPERLLSVQDRAIVVDALAGSSPRGQSVGQDADLAHRLLHSPKERHEHQVVVDFIVQRLEEAGVMPQFAIAPTLLQLSNIQHLHTPIHARIPPTLHPLDLIERLHPTPAVAGLSREAACAEILRHESFERSLYAAPIGWMDQQGNGEFVVGIRSALLDGDRARLYAGAGIVAGSDPDRELAEVHLKLQTLLQALV